MSGVDDKEIDEFIAGLVPLDLILFQGVSMFSKLIRNGSALSRGNGQFSHCALVVSGDLCPSISGFEKNNELLLMEVTVSIFSKVANIETGKFSFGAQIRDLRGVLKEMLGEECGVAVCHLRNNPYLAAKETGDDVELKKIQDTMDKIYDNFFAYDQSLYDLNIFALLGTIFPSVRPLRDDVEAMFSFIRDNHPWLFCSELACITYKELGLLDNEIDVQNYLPVDFVNPGENNELHSIMQLPPIFLKRITKLPEKKINLRKSRELCCFL